jgi:hypothetical protein
MLGLLRLPDRGGRARPRLRLPSTGVAWAQQHDLGTEQAARGGGIAAITAGLFLVMLLALTLLWWGAEPDCQRPGIATFDASCAAHQTDNNSATRP